MAVKPKQQEREMEIKILGPGCAKCKEVEQIVAAASAAAGVTVSVEKISDFKEIAK